MSNCKSLCVTLGDSEAGTLAETNDHLIDFEYSDMRVDDHGMGALQYQPGYEMETESFHMMWRVNIFSRN